MTDIATADLSTKIDTEPAPSASGGGEVLNPQPVEAEPKEARSLRDDLEHVFKADAKKRADETKDEKADPAPKGDDEEKGKGAPKQEEDGSKPDKADPAPDAKSAEPKEDKQDTRRIDPPAKFLPDAKEKWTNVPRAVQRDIETMVREHEAASQQTRQASERYETIRQYDELARSNGRELSDSLQRVAEIEDLMQANPLAGLNRILMEAGPRKADGQPVSLFELAQFVVQQGQQSYQQMVSQAAPRSRTQQANPEVEQLKQQFAAMQQHQVESAVIAPFRAANPRYDELQDDIAFFLQSGKIATTLSLQDRLAAAYDMAVRINPASHDESKAANQNDGPDPARRADDGFSGSKSIKSAPGSVSEEIEVEAKAGESTRDSLMKELRRLAR